MGFLLARRAFRLLPLISSGEVVDCEISDDLASFFQHSLQASDAENRLYSYVHGFASGVIYARFQIVLGFGFVSTTSD